MTWFLPKTCTFRRFFLLKIFFFFKDEQCKETGTLWSSLPGVEAAVADVLAFQGSPSTVQRKSLGCAAAAKLFNVAAVPLNKLYAFLSLSFTIFKMVIVQGHSQLLKATFYRCLDSPGTSVDVFCL